MTLGSLIIITMIARPAISREAESDRETSAVTGVQSAVEEVDQGLEKGHAEIIVEREENGPSVENERTGRDRRRRRRSARRERDRERDVNRVFHRCGRVMSSVSATSKSFTFLI